MVRPKRSSDFISPKKKSPRSKPTSSAASSTAKIRPDVSARLKDEYSKEKKLVKLLDETAVKYLTSSKVFQSVGHINWPALNDQRKLSMTTTDTAHKGIGRLLSLLDGRDTFDIKNGKYTSLDRRIVVCLKCFQSPNTSLHECLIACGSNKSSSNIIQHRRIYHPEDVDLVTEEEKRVNKESDGAMYRFVQQLPMSKNESARYVKEAIYRCVNDLGFPASTVTHPRFREMLFAVKNNASQLSTNDLKLSTKSITEMRVKFYTDFVELVRTLMVNVRQEFKSLCGRQIPFASICHDIWKGYKREVLGVSAMFADPRNAQIYKIPVGLFIADGHSATQIAEMTKSLLDCFGIYPNDICSAINDNTNGAVLAGKYIVGNINAECKCDMHRAELILKHASGLMKRTLNKVVVDEFPGFVKIYKKFYTFAAWLMSRRVRERFDKLRECSHRNNNDVIEIPLPNQTRVAGAHILFFALLRNKWAMDNYSMLTIGGNTDFVQNYPSAEEWNQLAEFEGIMKSLTSLSMSLQSDDPSANSASLVQIYLTQHEINRMKIKGVNCLSMTATDHETLWDGKTKTSIIDSFRKKRNFTDLTPDSRKFINRILKELKFYFMSGEYKTTDTAAEKALCANPLLCFRMPELFKKMLIYEDKDVKALYEQFVVDMADKFSNRPSTIGAAFARQQDIAEKLNGNDTNNVEKDDDSNDGNVFKRFFLEEQVVKQTMRQISGLANEAGENVRKREQLEADCREAFQNFQHCCKQEVDENWSKIIQKYPTEAFVKDSKKWTSEEKLQFDVNCKIWNYLKVGKYFDVMGWWKDHAKRFPMLYPSAMIWLVKPATNAFQERVFSLASWFQSNKLMRRLTDKNFEMRAMEALTRGIRDTIEEQEQIIRKRGEERSSYEVFTGEDGEQGNEDGEQGNDGIPHVLSVRDRLKDMTNHYALFNKTWGETTETTPSQEVVINYLDDNDAEQKADGIEVLVFTSDEYTEEENRLSAGVHEDSPPDLEGDSDETLLDTLETKFDVQETLLHDVTPVDDKGNPSMEMNMASKPVIVDIDKEDDKEDDKYIYLDVTRDDNEDEEIDKGEQKDSSDDSDSKYTDSDPSSEKKEEESDEQSTSNDDRNNKNDGHRNKKDDENLSSGSVPLQEPSLRKRKRSKTMDATMKKKTSKSSSKRKRKSSMGLRSSEKNKRKTRSERP